MMPKNEPVVLQQRQTLPVSGKDVMIISINRPDKKNCFNAEVSNCLATAFRSIRNDTDLAAVILRGQGSSFCAGADLSDPPNPLPASSDLSRHLDQNPVHQMSSLKVPLIAALTGYVITGGFELALACDILVGDESVVFRDTHCKFNLAPCWGLSQRLQRRIGPGRAKIMSLGAVPIRAEQALSWGLLDDLVTKGNVLDRALEIADSIGKNESDMVIHYKRVMKEGGETTLAEGLKRERALGLAYYNEVLSDGVTFHRAKDFITDGERPRHRSNL